MTRRAREYIKTCAIILLTASAVWLAAASGIFDGFFSTMRGGRDDGQFTDALSSVAAAARPTVIVAVNDAGLRSAAIYDAAALDMFYERTEGLIGMSVGAAREPERVSEDAFRRALSSGGIMYEYYDFMRLDLIAAWLGARPPDWSAGFSVRRICLNFDDNTLYFQGEGMYFASATESFGGHAGIAETYTDDLPYVFETDFGGAAPYTLLLPGYTFPIAAAANPLENEEALAAVLLGIGVPQGVPPSYTDADGTRMYIMNTFTLTASRGGEIVYRRIDETDAANTAYTPLADAVEIARAAALPCAERAGEARLYCTSAVWSGDAVTVSFNYFLHGARVFVSGGDAARIEIRGGRVTQMTLNFRVFSSQDGAAATLMPVRQALAASHDEFRLGYSAGGVMIPFWYAAEG